ncbi:hypothetical protein I7I50_07326 [Histoplasma capsulatum G186AR]|uniref:Uncharacterized protein n=1 Tax=Ajellomyces capsulatus TaxID=5037 RepID=A0A8H8D2M0_AJECA|nr:hypothetical protein I7I52_09602 [Histoplasma capsulatum]QSS68049.1 hypothetical protein I7I50_07326 [Histoplasma capsulatum G186AR]
MFLLDLINDAGFWSAILFYTYFCVYFFTFLFFSFIFTRGSISFLTYDLFATMFIPTILWRSIQ